MPRPSRSAASAGFTLIEVMVALMILVVVAVLAATTLLSVLRSTTNDRSRVAAANLASRELEIVRAAFESPLQGPQSIALGQVVNAAPLAGGAVGAPLIVDNRSYTVTRTSQWETQGATAGPCDGGASGQLAYLRVSVKVTWPDIGTTTPVTNATLLTPPLGTYNSGTGHIKAKVVDQNGVAEAGTTVSVLNSSGASVGSQLTASDGCAFFAFLAPGSYTVSLSRTGYVDRAWRPAPSQQVTVVANVAAPAPFDYAAAATVAFAIDQSSPTYPPAAATALTVYNENLPSNTHTLSYPSSAYSQPLSVWPYTGGLAAWTGDCTDADPLTPPGTTRASPVSTTAGTLTNAVVLGAAVGVQVTRTGAPLSGASVEAVHATSGCPSSLADPFYPTVTVGEALRLPGVTDSTGTVRVLLPFGTWTLKVAGQAAATTWPAVTFASNATYPAATTVAIP